jgi:2-oxoglutarate ferredoxin oxidoreductase subunit alpha
VVVVEQNHGAQLFQYLRGQMQFEVPVASYSRAGPVPLNGQAIADHITRESKQ